MAIDMEIHNRHTYFIRISYINAQFISKQKFMSYYNSARANVKANVGLI
jgi:hypothetical protein